MTTRVTVKNELSHPSHIIKISILEQLKLASTIIVQNGEAHEITIWDGRSFIVEELAQV